MNWVMIIIIFYDFVQNIADFFKKKFLDKRQLGFFLFFEQFGKVYLCKQYWNIYIFLPTRSLKNLKTLNEYYWIFMVISLFEWI